MPQHERILDKRHLPVYELHIRPIADPTAHIAAQDLICVYLRQRQILPQADLPRRFYYKTLHSISYPPFSVLCRTSPADQASGASAPQFHRQPHPAPETAAAQGLIEYVGDDCINALYAAIEARSIRPGICKTAGLKLVYSPLNGSGLVPVTHVLKEIGITDITVVPEQEKPDGNFPTCPYPNPEIFEALRLGLELAKKPGADLMLATDPDADRVGIAVKCKDGSYELLSGNEVGVLLLDYICAGRIEQGTMPKNAVMCKSIVSTPLADKVAEHYGVECRNVLTGFKWIGDQIAKLEADGEVDRFIFGFEESYGYLAGPYVRDKDAIIGSMLICEMAAYYRAKGSSIKEELERIYTEYGRYLNKVDSFEFPGLSGMDKMADIMQNLRVNPPKDFAGDKVVKVVDYKKPEETGLPAANVLIYTLESGATVVVRPSGTEPKIKTYFTTKGKDLAEAEAQKEKLAEACKPLLA